MTDSQIVDLLWEKYKDRLVYDQEGQSFKISELMGPQEFHALVLEQPKSWAYPFVDAFQRFLEGTKQDVWGSLLLAGRLTGFVSPEYFDHFQKQLEHQHRFFLGETLHDPAQRVIAKTAELLGEGASQVAALVGPGKIRSLFQVAAGAQIINSLAPIYSDVERKEWNKLWEDVSRTTMGFVGGGIGLKAADVIKAMHPALKFITLSGAAATAAAVQSAPDLHPFKNGKESQGDFLEDWLSGTAFNLVAIGATAWAHGGFRKPKPAEPTPQEEKAGFEPPITFREPESPPTPTPQPPQPSPEPQPPTQPPSTTQPSPPTETPPTPPAPMEEAIPPPSTTQPPTPTSPEGKTAPAPQESLTASEPHAPSFTTEDGVKVETISPDLVPLEDREKNIPTPSPEAAEYIKDNFGKSYLKDFADFLQNTNPFPVPSTEKFLDSPMADVTADVKPADVPLIAKSTAEIEVPTEGLTKEERELLESTEVPEEPPPPEIAEEIEEKLPIEPETTEEFAKQDLLDLYQQQLQSFEERGEVPEEFYDLLGKGPEEFTEDDLDLVREELQARIRALQSQMPKKLEAAQQKRKEEESTRKKRKRRIKASKEDVEVAVELPEKEEKPKRKRKPKLSKDEKEKLVEVTKKAINAEGLDANQSQAFWGILNDIQNAWHTHSPGEPLVFREPEILAKYDIQDRDKAQEVFDKVADVLREHGAGDSDVTWERSGNQLYGIFKVFPNQPTKFMLGIDPADVWHGIKGGLRLISRFPRKIQDIRFAEKHPLAKAVIDMAPGFWSMAAEQVKPVLRAVNGQVAAMRSRGLRKLSFAGAIFEKYNDNDKLSIGRFIEDPNPTWQKHSYAIRLMQQNSYLKDAVKTIKHFADKMYESEQRAGIEYEREDAYLPHIYEEFSKADQYFSMPQWASKIGKPFFLKTRTYATLEEAMKAGLTPISLNPAVLTMIRFDAHLRAMRRQEIVNGLEKAGLVFKDPGNDPRWNPAREDHKTIINAIRDRAVREGYKQFRVNGKDYWAPNNPALWSALDILDLDPEKRAARARSSALKTANDMLGALQKAKLWDLKFKFAIPLPHALHITFSNLPHHIATELAHAEHFFEFPERMIRALSTAHKTFRSGINDPDLDKVFQAMRGEDVQEFGPEHVRIFNILTKSGIKLEDPDLWPDPRDYIGEDGKFNARRYKKEIAEEVWRKDPERRKELSNLVTPGSKAEFLLKESLDNVFFLTRWVFKEYIPRMKARAILEYVERMEEHDPDFWTKVDKFPDGLEAQAFRRQAERVERTYGEMNYANLLTPRFIRRLAVAFHISFGFRVTEYLTNLPGVIGSALKYVIHREAVDDWIAMQQRGAEIFKKPVPTVDELKRRYESMLALEAKEAGYKAIFTMTYVGLAAALGTAISSLVRQYYNLPPPQNAEETIKDMAFPVMGVGPDGRPIRAKPLWFMKDFVPETIALMREGIPGMAHEMLEEELHALNPLPSAFSYLYQNADYFGREIVNPYSPMMEKTKQFFSWAGETFLLPMTLEQELAAHGGTLSERIEEAAKDPGAYVRATIGGRAKKMEATHDESLIREALHRYRHTIKPENKYEEAHVEVMRIVADKGPEAAQEWILDKWQDYGLTKRELGQLLQTLRTPEPDRLGRVLRTLPEEVQIGVFLRLQEKYRWWKYLKGEARRKILEQHPEIFSGRSSSDTPSLPQVEVPTSG
jgi:hypothetical protein